MADLPRGAKIGPFLYALQQSTIISRTTEIHIRVKNMKKKTIILALKIYDNSAKILEIENQLFSDFLLGFHTSHTITRNHFPFFYNFMFLIKK